MEKSDRMGKKNLKGFYKYSPDGKRLEVDQAVYSEMGLSQPTNPLSEKECIERGVFAMVNECALALIEDRIVETPHEVDLAMIMGTGFPPFRGGLLKYADTLGTQFIVDQLEVYAAKKAPRLKPSQPLKNLAKNSRRFYQ
jgi:3-hydroxyacyl-CoA dehydrogenase/enoyl-CoA hydratase/3-hydroxybutyryl-CoA epimerase